MRKLLLGSIAGLMVAGVAQAADMPLKAAPYAQRGFCTYGAPGQFPVNWTGSYFGVQGGGGWGHQERVITDGGFTNKYDARGGLFGVHWGYNCDLGHLVIGVMGDANRAWIKGDDNGVGGTVDQTTTRWLTSGNVRAGFTLGGARQWLLYGTAGVSYANFNHNNPSGAPINNSVSQPGWNVGAGLEWAPASFPGLSWAIEYRHYDFERYNLAPGGLAQFSVKPTVDTVTLRLSFH